MEQRREKGATYKGEKLFIEIVDIENQRALGRSEYAEVPQMTIAAERQGYLLKVVVLFALFHGLEYNAFIVTPRSLTGSRKNENRLEHQTRSPQMGLLNAHDYE